MQKFRIVEFKVFEDERGKLVPVELKDYVDWEVKRFYYVTDVKLPRGGHAVRGEKKIYVMMQGSALARIHDGQDWQEIKLQGPSQALIMDQMCFREFADFSEGAVLAVLSNMNYDPESYIYDLEEFIKEVNQS